MRLVIFLSVMIGLWMTCLAATAADQPAPVAIVDLQASDHHEGNIPEHAIDGEEETSWSARGYGQWLLLEVDQPVTVQSISLAFKHGESRGYTICIDLSEDRRQWRRVFMGTSRPGSTRPQKFELTPAIARFVRITGMGNSENDWINITRIRINDRPLRKVVRLSEPAAVEGMKAVAFGPIEPLAIWGADSRQPVYFDEWLSPLFERRLQFDQLDLTDARLEWIFTGPLGSVTLAITATEVTLTEQFHDSPAYLLSKSFKAGSTAHPQTTGRVDSAAYSGELQAVSVVCDHHLRLSVRLNDQTVLERSQMFDLQRHQLNLTGNAEADAVGRLLSPEPEPVELTVRPQERHQTIIGFGGIPSLPAYHELSEAGRRKWWQLLCEYNLLVHREYPVGMLLNEAMDNWTDLGDARPHYYADNFPNGEVSDWAYLRKVRQIGGIVMFEFWQLPPWVGDDVDLYAQAVVTYCRRLTEQTGSPPEIVGVQNEVSHPQPVFDAMTEALRRHLDEAGFTEIRIHMPDAGHLVPGIQRLQQYRQSGASWDLIDYTAVHMYDFQAVFQDPDRFDDSLRRWRELSAGKPFISNEISFHRQQWQWPSYRVALTLGQLYHKNLVLVDAVVLAHCWTLLSVEQPSYGWTRSLCVPDRENGFVPKPSSHLLRVFGSFSRRVQVGMQRVTVNHDQSDLLASAYHDDDGRATLVALNRGTEPLRLQIDWPDVLFTAMELTDQYHANAIRSAPEPMLDGSWELVIEPGTIITLSNVELIECPAEVLN